MKTKKITKIISILFVIAAIALSLNMVFASDIAIPSPSAVNDTGLNTTISNVLGVVTVICYAAAFILLIVLGVKWLIAAPDAKADMKKSAIVYVVGAIMVFAAGAILQVIRGLAKSTVKSGT